MAGFGSIFIFIIFGLIAFVQYKAKSEEQNQGPTQLPRRLEPSAPQETAYEREKREYQEHVEEYSRNLESSKEALKGLRDGFVKLGEAIQEANEKSDAEDASSAGSYQYYEPAHYSEAPIDAPPAKKKPLSATVLRDDRRNDWMAKQMREEARIRNSTDLGAMHDASCEAREIKERHAALHRAGRVDL